MGGNFTNTAAEAKNIDSLFNLLRAHASGNLIIDMRDNGGGDSHMGDQIFAYITSKPYTQMSRTDLKVSQYQIKRRERGYRGLEGLIVTSWDSPKEPPNRGFKYNGHVWLMFNNFTASSAGLFAHTFKDFNMGTTVGEETGGMREGFGDLLAFYTPAYAVFYVCSYKKFYAPVPRPDDLLHGTVPDIPFTESALKPYAQNADPGLAYTLDLVRERVLPIYLDREQFEC